MTFGGSPRVPCPKPWRRRDAEEGALQSSGIDLHWLCRHPAFLAPHQAPEARHKLVQPAVLWRAGYQVAMVTSAVGAAPLLSNLYEHPGCQQSHLDSNHPLWRWGIKKRGVLPPDVGTTINHPYSLDGLAMLTSPERARLFVRSASRRPAEGGPPALRFSWHRHSCLCSDELPASKRNHQQSDRKIMVPGVALEY